jgi:cytochrome c-type biogenesis protein
MKKVWWAIALFAITLSIAVLANQVSFISLLQPLQEIVFRLEEPLQHWIAQPEAKNPLFLLAIAFLGGLVASLSPCIICLLPINLTYIGTRTITSRRDAFSKASLFVLGVVTTLSLLGLVSSFAGAVMVQYRGYIDVVVGIIIVVMGGSLLGWIRLPLPQTDFKVPTGAYGFGLTFALVASPCSSPVLLAILSAAAATGSSVMSVITMVSYALGYTAILFFASLFAGFTQQMKGWLKYADRLFHIGGAVMLLLGCFYVIKGTTWITVVL